MAADPLDDLLHDRLSDFTDPGDPAAWPDLARRLDEAMGPDPAGADTSMGGRLKDYQAPGPVSGWDRIASTLDQADRAFDETVRRRVSGFEIPHDEGSWGRLLAYWQDSRYLRTRLVMIKGIEAMTLLLLLLSSVRYDWIGPSTQPGPGHHTESMIIAQAEAPQDRQLASSEQVPADPSKVEIAFPASACPSGQNKTHSPARLETTPVDLTPGESGNHPISLETSPVPTLDIQIQPITGYASRTASLTSPMNDASVPGPSFRTMSETGEKAHAFLRDMAGTLDMDSPRPEIRLASLASVDMTGLTPWARTSETTPQVAAVEARARSRAEISLFLLTDVSALRMPEERIYSLGQQVIFPEKRMVSQGYGGGFTIATGHPRYALEMGIQYSARTFRPGRRVTLGDAFDNSTVDFQALRLQLVSIPLQARYRLDRTGRIRTYAAAGMTFTVVAQSDLDVVSSYNFNSLAAGEDPNADPLLARTIRETRRISEHLRDGTPFSSKNYVSLQGGFGLEYILHPSRKLFVQALAQYQIPNLEFSNHNGKDLRAVMIQAGLRSSLGY